jgi:hypothetical protein
MSLLTNTTTFRIGSFKRWIAPWYETNPIYSTSLFNELYIYEFLHGIYYQLKIPNSLPLIYENNLNQLIIRIQLYIFRKKKQKRNIVLFKHFYSYSRKQKKILWYLSKIVTLLHFFKLRFQYKYIMFLFNSTNNKYIIKQLFVKKRELIDRYYTSLLKKKLPNYSMKQKNKKYSFLLEKNNKINTQITNTSNMILASYFFINNNMNIYLINTIKKNNKIYFLQIKNKFYKMFNSIFFSNIYSYILKKKIIKQIKFFYLKKINWRKKFKIKNKISFWKKKKIKNKINNKYKLKKNNKLYIFKNRIYRNIYKKWKIKKLNSYINKLRKIKNIRNKKKKQYLIFKRKKIKWKLKRKIKKNRKKKLLKKKKKFKIKKELIFEKKKKLLKKKKYIKYKNISKKIRRTYISLKNSQSYYFLMFVWIINKCIKWVLLLIIQYLIYFKIILSKIKYNKNKIIPLFYNKIKKVIIFINNIKMIPIFKIKKNKIIILKKKEIKWHYIIHNFKKRIKKKKKWFTRYYMYIMLMHLRLKIINTLYIYMNKQILFLPFYKKKKFPFLTDPKIIADYLKIKMQFAKSIRYVLISLVKKHSRQRKRRYHRKTRLMKKLYTFRKLIRYKLIQNTMAVINSNVFSKKKKNKKTINRNNFKIKKFINFNKNRYFKKNKYLKKKQLKYKLYINQLEKKINIHKKKRNIYKKKIKKYIKFNINKKTNIKNKIRKKFIIKYNNKIKYYRKKTRNILFLWKKYFKIIKYKFFPLIGIRVECAGPTKKGKRTRIIHYNEWVRHYRLPGKMPNSTVMTDVSYWQTYARIKRAAIGIKIWLYQYSPYITMNANRTQLNTFLKVKKEKT